MSEVDTPPVFRRHEDDTVSVYCEQGHWPNTIEITGEVFRINGFPNITIHTEDNQIEKVEFKAVNGEAIYSIYEYDSKDDIYTAVLDHGDYENYEEDV